MNRKGFTLIELLAVIVILAVIALIATPAVLNIIEDSRKSAAEASARNIISAAKTFYMNETMNGRTPGSVDLSTNTLKYDGDQASKGNISFTNGDASGKMYVGGYCVEVDIDGKVESEKTTEDECSVDDSKPTFSYTFNDGDVVYFDVENGGYCEEGKYHVDNSLTGYNGLSTTKTTANQTGCLKFYAFLSSEGETANLLLDHNTTDKGGWASNVNNGPSTESEYALGLLKSATDGWNGTLALENYSIEQPDIHDHYGTYVIDYTGYKARLITAQEVADVVGLSSTIDGLGFDETIEVAEYGISGNSTLYFDGTGTTSSGWTTQVVGSDKNKKLSDYSWLYDRTSTTCTEYGCNNNSDIETNGYWTATNVTYVGNYAWKVDYMGALAGQHVADSNGVVYAGIRPVIEVLK